MNRFLESFSLAKEKEDFEVVIDGVEKGVSFSGTNLWILVFAIFIASLGLNVNSTAVVIGAMLVSPLMGPIMGLGMGIAINDLQLLKKALSNYAFAVGVGLTTSTIFFLLSPLNDASSEILARTSPTIYDVLIAFFGGFAGILAISSRQKGNVIPGVAIATALMPPLCTAGYGLANWNLNYIFGAFYLFVINTVFIALATLITARVLSFPRRHLEDVHADVVSQRIIWLVAIITLLPSVYFGYDIVQQHRFRQGANLFVDNEAVFPNDYLLKRSIDAKSRSISLTYGGELIPESAIEELRSKLSKYDLAGSKLDIKQGFAIFASSQDDNKTSQVNELLNEKERELASLKNEVSKTNAEKLLGEQIFGELKAQYPLIDNCVIERGTRFDGSEPDPVWLAVIVSSKKLAQSDQTRIEDFLKVRVSTEEISVYFEVAKEPVVTPP